MSLSRSTIGIVGGMGPLAGVELFRKLILNVDASTDQEHPPVVLMSYPHRLPDRTAYLTGGSTKSPAPAIADILRSMDRLGVAVAGIACNTAHAPQILDEVLREMRRHNCSVRVVHMIDETVRMIGDNYPSVRRVGMLSTRGTRRTRLYAHALLSAGFELVELDDDTHDALSHRAVYDPESGIKAGRTDLSTARGLIEDGVRHLSVLGADAVILGCTELPLALPDRDLDGIPLIDPSTALARALVREAIPDRLARWDNSGR